MESWDESGVQPRDFEWLLTDAQGPERHHATHAVAFATQGQPRLHLDLKQWPFVSVATQPQIFALQRRDVPQE